MWSEYAGDSRPLTTIDRKHRLPFLSRLGATPTTAKHFFMSGAKTLTLSLTAILITTVLVRVYKCQPAFVFTLGVRILF